MRFVPLLAALALLALLAASPAVGAPAPDRTPIAAAPAPATSAWRSGLLPLRTIWLPCYRADGPFQCAIVWAPLDYDRPAAGLVGLFLIRLPAADEKRRIGSLFVNPGGPGGSGVDFVRFASGLFPDEVRARFDLVGFDPRGINRSTPLRCFRSADEWGPWFTPFAFPLTPEEEEIWIEADRFLIDACERTGGRIIDHMSTANVARDLDWMRRALRDPKLSYVGYSYGSYIGSTYANLFPQNVRALVVDGVLDPVEWATGTGSEGSTIPFSTRLESDVGARDTLEEFFRLCDEGGPACAFSGNAADRFADLADSLRAQPVEVVFPDGSGFVLDYSGLIAMTLGALYNSFSWPDHAQFLADVEAAAAAAADGTATVQAGARAQAAASRQAAPYMPGWLTRERYVNDIEGFPGVACSDTDNPDDFGAWSTAGAAADAAHGYFGRIWTWVTSVCAEWPGADTGRFTGPWTSATSKPVLVIGNLYDPATPYHGALKVRSLLPNSALLTVHAWGHTSLGFSSCADEALTRYLVDGVTPAPGTVCPADVVPFAD